jgi:hypothetical protein
LNHLSIRVERKRADKWGPSPFLSDIDFARELIGDIENALLK